MFTGVMNCYMSIKSDGEIAKLNGFIADILGGNKVVLVGSLIQDQLMKAHNWPFAAALSVVLMILTSLMISLYKRVTHTTELEGIL